MKTLLSFLLVLGVIGYFGYLYIFQKNTNDIKYESDAFRVTIQKPIKKTIRSKELSIDKPAETSGIVRAIEDGKIFIDINTDKEFIPTDEVTLQIGDEITVRDNSNFDE